MCYWTPGKYTSRVLKGTQKQQALETLSGAASPGYEYSPAINRFELCEKMNANINVNIQKLDFAELIKWKLLLKHAT